MRSLIIFAAVCACLPYPAWAVDSTPASEPQSAVALAGAYQSGYFQLAAVSAFQLYSSTGIIQGDLLDGSISPALALNALEHNSLLQSVCATTLEEIRGLTPPEDTVAMSELDQLISVNTAEGELLRALADLCTAPSDAVYQAVLAAQREVESQLESYAGANRLGLQPAPDA